MMTKTYEARLFLVYLTLLSSRLQRILLVFSDSGDDGEREDESQTEFRVQTLDSGMLELKQAFLSHTPTLHHIISERCFELCVLFLCL